MFQVFLCDGSTQFCEQETIIYTFILVKIFFLPFSNLHLQVLINIERRKVKQFEDSLSFTAALPYFSNKC